MDDSLADLNLAFSNLVEFVNNNKCLHENTLSCHYLGSQQSVVSLGLKSTYGSGSNAVKILRYAHKT